MSRTFRNLPRSRATRRPKYRHHLLAGKSPRQIVTDWDDKPIAARHEIIITRWDDPVAV